MPGVPVTFEPPGVTVEVEPGTRLLEAARTAGVPLAATCGGRGTCGDCAVRVLEGEVAPPSEFELAALAGAPPGVRLACLVRVTSAVTVRPLGLAAAPAEAGAPAPIAVTRRVAAAVDLGTTTVTARLLSSDDGRVLGEGSAVNPQRGYGGDVASRMSAAIEGHGGALRELAVAGITEALRAAGAAEGARLERIVVAGNTVMTHLALGADVSRLAVRPYTPAVTGTVRLPAAQALPGLPWPDAAVVFLPSLDAFVGGDLTAGVLATDLDEPGPVRVLVDLGTNAEVVVAAGGALTVASAAAGPAFEAAGLACGGPAMPGAIRRVIALDSRLELDVIGGGEAWSLCGSGALSLVAALLTLGHLDGDGRFIVDGPLEPRFHEREGVTTLQLAGERGTPRDVYLTQRDVRELQLAKGAVATALAMSLEAAGASWGDVDSLMVAGALGSSADADLLVRLGVLPAEAAPAVLALGDTALTGAALVAADPAEEDRAARIAGRVRGFELAADPSFQSAFVARLGFPEV